MPMVAAENTGIPKKAVFFEAFDLIGFTLLPIYGEGVGGILAPLDRLPHIVIRFWRNPFVSFKKEAIQKAAL